MWRSLIIYEISDGFIVAAGVILSIVSSLLVCVGLGVQKVSLTTPENAQVPAFRQTKYLMGFLCMILGNIIDFVAFGMAPASLLAPLAALTLIWNLFVASYLLHEKFDRNDVIAVLLVFIGTAVTVGFSSHEEKTYSLETLLALYEQPRMKIYMVVIPILLGIHYAAFKYVQMYDPPHPRWNTVDLVGRTGFAGILGGQSILFAKSSIELLKDAFHGSDTFAHVETYLIIVLTVTLLLLQINVLNGAMRRHEQLYVLPLYQSYWIISSEISGLVYFGEWDTLSTVQVRFFIVGTIITLVGLYQLTKKEAQTHALAMDHIPHIELGRIAVVPEEDDDNIEEDSSSDDDTIRQPKRKSRSFQSFDLTPISTDEIIVSRTHSPGVMRSPLSGPGRFRGSPRIDPELVPK